MTTTIRVTLLLVVLVGAAVMGLTTAPMVGEADRMTTPRPVPLMRRSRAG